MTGHGYLKLPVPGIKLIPPHRTKASSYNAAPSRSQTPYATPRPTASHPSPTGSINRHAELPNRRLLYALSDRTTRRSGWTALLGMH